MSWVKQNFLTSGMAAALANARQAANRAADRASRQGAFSAGDVLRATARAAAVGLDSAFGADGLKTVARSVDDDVDDATFSAVDAARSSYSNFHHDAERAVWTNISCDCDWLERHVDSSKAARELALQPLWPVNMTKQSLDASTSVMKRLLALKDENNRNQHYQIWIDWYNRRIIGLEAAFDIPGDLDRIHDKMILERLVEATDIDFWSNGPTYVNTMLQSWIDESRIEEIIRKLRNGTVPRYDSPEASVARAAVLQEIDRLLSEISDPRLGIGGNQPPEEIDADERPVDADERRAALPSFIREPIADIKTEFEVSQPDALKIAEKSKLLIRLMTWRADIAEVTGHHFAKGFGEEIGKLAAGDVRKLLYVIVVGLLSFITAFLGIIVGLMP